MKLEATRCGGPLRQYQSARAEQSTSVPAVSGETVNWGSNAERAAAISNAIETETPWLDAAGATSAPAGDFATVARSMFPLIDTDHNGFLSSDEIDRAVVDPQLTGEEASVVATLNRLSHEIERLFDDEWGLEGDGVTLKDLEAFEQGKDVPADLRRRVSARFENGKTTIAGQDFTLYGPTGRPSPEGVNQGAWGDCYFLAAVAAVVAREPRTIMDLITPDDKEERSYTVTFPNQSPQSIPRPTEAEIAMFASGGHNGFWVNVLEKAYGRLLDPNITVPQEGVPEGGKLKGIEVLTGKPAERYSVLLNTADTLRQELTEAFAQRRIVTASLQKPFPWERDPTGLPTGHAYTVLTWNEASEILTLRNPWGDTERVDQPDGANDGVFEMRFEEFASVFDFINLEGGAGLPPALEFPPADHLHQVLQGETLSGIADRYYGIMRLFGDLVTANWPEVTDPDKIEAGMTLKIPRMRVPQISISPGDTLNSLALYWYGDAGRASEIFDANRDVLADPEQIPEGVSVKIPMTGAELPPLE